MKKKIPDPLYPCKFCYEEYSWPAEDLFWSEKEQAWVCDYCRGDQVHGEPFPNWSLAQELTAREKSDEL